MEYEIAAEDSVEVLAEVVQDFLDDGWQLVGAPFEFKKRICQAMTRKPQLNMPLRSFGYIKEDEV